MTVVATRPGLFVGLLESGCAIAGLAAGGLPCLETLDCVLRSPTPETSAVQSFGRELRSLWVSGVGFSDLGSRLTVGYRPGGFVKRVALEVLTGKIATQAGSLFVSGRFKSVLNHLINPNEGRPLTPRGAGCLARRGTPAPSPSKCALRGSSFSPSSN